MHACMHACMCVCAWVYVCMYVCIYVTLRIQTEHSSNSNAFNWEYYISFGLTPIVELYYY